MNVDSSGMSGQQTASCRKHVFLSYTDTYVTLSKRWMSFWQNVFLVQRSEPDSVFLARKTASLRDLVRKHQLRSGHVASEETPHVCGVKEEAACFQVNGAQVFLFF